MKGSRQQSGLVYTQHGTHTIR